MILKVVNLSFLYNNSPGKTQALTGVSFMASAGEVLGVIGPSGAGKSCLLHCLAGAFKPLSGTIEATKEIGIMAPAKISLVIQEAEKLFFNETVRDEVAAVLVGSASVQEERVKASLDKIGYEGKLENCPYRLSGGEQRKVALAALLIQEPDILLLDEPTIGLDGPGMAGLQSLIGNYQQEGRIVLVVSHDLDFLLKVAGRFLVLDQGRLAADFSRSQFGLKVKLLDQLGIGVPEIIQLSLKQTPGFVKDFIANIN